VSAEAWYVVAVAFILIAPWALAGLVTWRKRARPPMPDEISYLTRWWWIRLQLTAARIVLIRYPWPERAGRWLRVLRLVVRQQWRWRGVTYPELAHIGIKMAIRASARREDEDDDEPDDE
jgi:hypothetical protein